MLYSEYHNQIKEQARNQIDRLLFENSAKDELVYIVKFVKDMAVQEGRKDPKVFPLIYDIVKESAPRIVQAFHVSSPYLLGYGSYGIALAIGDNRVLKITTDKKEMMSCAALLGKKLPNVMDVIRVMKKKNANVFFIEYPKYTMLTSIKSSVARMYTTKESENTLRQFMENAADVLCGDYEILDKFGVSAKKDDEFDNAKEKTNHILETNSFFAEHFSTDEKKEGIQQVFLRLALNSFGDDGSKLFETLYGGGDVMDFVTQILTGVDALQKAGILKFRDFHSENIAYQNGEYILMDLGSNSVYGRKASGYQILEAVGVT